MAPSSPVAFLLLFCLLSHCCSLPISAKLLTHLPGFHGALPFSLETGYVRVDEANGAELFYYFVESESRPAADPFLLWLTGGWRCSVFSGLAFEIGPVKFIVEPYNGSLPQLQYNPHSWTKVANILFVDSPVGAGFSYSENPKGYEVGDISASLQLHKFLMKWFHDHPKYLTNPFYIGGDSKAGKIVPFIAQKISEDIEAGKRPLLNLKGYLVGNPATGESIDKTSKVPYAHGVGIISDQLYEMILGHCQEEDYMNPKNAVCAQALNTFNKLVSEVWQAHILYNNCILVSPTRSSMDASRKILKEEYEVLHNPPPRPPFDCPSYAGYLSYFWANSKVTRDALGIKKGTVEEWVRCNRGLPYVEDIESSLKYHRNVTMKGYRALVYSGDHDLVVPFLGTQAWVRSLNFSIVDEWRAWHLNGQSAGFTITYSNNMTFATIKGGGHTAPEYQPEECFAMFRRWISNEPL